MESKERPRRSEDRGIGKKGIERKEEGKRRRG
jgi:hypothetical protein